MTLTDFFGQMDAIGFRPAAEIGVTVVEATPAYRVKGTTEDITLCDRCGRQELKRTVVMAQLDADGTEVDVFHAGTGCAATLAKLTEAEVIDQIEAIDTAAQITARRTEIAGTDAREGAYRTWLAVTYGVDLDLYATDPAAALTATPFDAIYPAKRAFRAAA